MASASHTAASVNPTENHAYSLMDSNYDLYSHYTKKKKGGDILLFKSFLPCLMWQLKNTYPCKAFIVAELFFPVIELMGPLFNVV